MLDGILGALAQAKAEYEFLQKEVKIREAAYNAKLKIAYEGWCKLTGDGSFTEPKISFEEFKAMKELDLL